MASSAGYACAMQGGRPQVNRCHSQRPGDDGLCDCPAANEYPTPPPIPRKSEAELQALLDPEQEFGQCPVCGIVEPWEDPEPYCLHSDDDGDESVPLIKRVYVPAPASVQGGES